MVASLPPLPSSAVSLGLWNSWYTELLLTKSGRSHVSVGIFLRLEDDGVSSQRKASFALPAQWEWINPGDCKESSILGKNRVPASGSRLKMCLANRQSANWSLGHRREGVPGPGRTGDSFQSNKSVQKDWGEMLRNLKGVSFSLYPVVFVSLSPDKCLLTVFKCLFSLS